MILDEILAAQKRGEAKGIASVCSSHPDVIKQALKISQNFGVTPLIEATCNQVNQYGGYTGMTPADFNGYVRRLAEEVDIPFGSILLGGDHLGPNVWQAEPAETAMKKAKVMVREYVRAGFTKIHLDCSMRLAGDPLGPLDKEVSAARAAELARVAEDTLPAHDQKGGIRYVIGTEVPQPGGATGHEERVRVTSAEDAQQSIEVTRAAFQKRGVEDAWERVRALVVQPGVEFGDDFVLPYRPEAALSLKQFIEEQPVVYEAHSTDYQTGESLKELVRDHFAILKVGPALTFAFREAVFFLAQLEDELFPAQERSNVVQVLDDVMIKSPEHWEKYYLGSEAEKAFKRRYSLSDRVRYYWVRPEVQGALQRLMDNLGQQTLPQELLKQSLGDVKGTAQEVIEWKINKVLNDYLLACGGDAGLC